MLFTVSCFKLKRFPSGVCRNELMQHTASFQIITCKNKLIHFNKPIMVMFWNRFFVLVCAVIAKMSPLSSLDISSNSLKTILWWTKNYAVKNNVNMTVFTPEQTDWLLSLTYKNLISLVPVKSRIWNTHLSTAVSDFFSTFEASNNLFWDSKSDHTKISLHENTN